MQELGHGKQRRLKAQLLWDILEPDTASKSAQSSPGSYFQNLSMPRGHLAVISEKADVPLHHSDIILEITRAAGYYSALPLKRWPRIQSLGITSKNADVDLQPLGVASKTLNSCSSARHYF
jgi:hypothetical protein